MIKLLSRLFIKDYKDTQNPAVRSKYGVLSGAVGIFFNILLFAAKLIAGIFSKSVAVIADAFNNLSDAAASIVTILGFKLSSKRPDKDHPFGHGRMEYIAGLIVSFLILIVGFELLQSSVQAIIHPAELDASVFAIVALVASILVKFYMFFYNSSLAKKLNSPAMKATAKDSLNDCISTAVVLAVTIVTHFYPEIKFPLDGIAGLVVACFILWGGYESVKETIDPLLGLKADPEFVSAIQKTVLTHKIVCGIHDLIVHDYGPGRRMISLHAEVPGDMNIFEIHDEIDRIEVELAMTFGCHATIHMDPIDTNNKELPVLKRYLMDVCAEINPKLSVHDLRMVTGQTHTNVIFDVVRPHDCKLSEEELTQHLFNKVQEYNKNYYAVVCVDQEFV